MTSFERGVLAVLLIVGSGLLAPALRPQTPPSAHASGAATVDLPSLLAKTAEYCRKLEASAFDFVCREEIHETVDPKLDGAVRAKPPTVYTGPAGGAGFLGPTIIVSTYRKAKRSFVYDYQCVRADQKIRETRTLIEENGRKKNVPDATLETSIVVWGNALFGPCGLFGERFQSDYVYTVFGQDVLEGKAAIIVDAKPKPGAPPTRNLYGRAWIDPAAGDILKIEWSESRVGNFDVFAQRGKLFERTPRLTIVSEFSIEKNGLRFPTHLNIEEAYVKESGKPFVRSRTDVVYKDFKFFTVTVEVR